MTRRLVPAVVAAMLAITCALAVRQWRAATIDASHRVRAERQLLSGEVARIRLERVEAPAIGAAAGPAQLGAAANCASPTLSPCGQVASRDSGPLPSAEALVPGALALRERLGVDGDDRDLLLILFSPTDCSLCLQESAQWVTLASKLGRGGPTSLAVIGIADRTTPGEMRNAARQMGLTFPVFVDRDSRVKHLLGVDETPFKVLMTAAGRVTLVDGPHQDLLGQQRFATRVREKFKR